MKDFEELRKTILKEAEQSKSRLILSGILIFIACGLTALFFPSKLQDVATISLILFCFNFGVSMGILFIGKKIDMKNGRGK